MNYCLELAMELKYRRQNACARPRIPPRSRHEFAYT